MIFVNLYGILKKSGLNRSLSKTVSSFPLLQKICIHRGVPLLPEMVNPYKFKEKRLRNMAQIDLSKYGITGTTEIVYNPSYEVLFEEET